MFLESVPFRQKNNRLLRRETLVDNVFPTFLQQVWRREKIPRDRIWRIRAGNQFKFWFVRFRHFFLFPSEFFTRFHSRFEGAYNGKTVHRKIMTLRRYTSNNVICRIAIELLCWRIYFWVGPETFRITHIFGPPYNNAYIDVGFLLFSNVSKAASRSGPKTFLTIFVRSFLNLFLLHPFVVYFVSHVRCCWYLAHAVFATFSVSIPIPHWRRCPSPPLSTVSTCRSRCLRSLREICTTFHYCKCKIIRSPTRLIARYLHTKYF